MIIDLKISKNDIESMSVLIKRNFQKSLCLSLVYLPPNSRIDIAIEFLDKLSDAVASMDCEWIMRGDFNVDLGCIKVSSKKRSLNK